MTVLLVIVSIVYCSDEPCTVKRWPTCTAEVISVALLKVKVVDPLVAETVPVVICAVVLNVADRRSARQNASRETRNSEELIEFLTAVSNCVPA